jgi:hypothetical protein
MLHLISIFIEVIILFLSLAIAINKKKNYGWGFVLTFGIYIVYDLFNQFGINPLGPWLNVLFFAASLSALYSIWILYKKK